jgi:hypothetical protein
MAAMINNPHSSNQGELDSEMAAFADFGNRGESA